MAAPFTNSGVPIPVVVINQTGSVPPVTGTVTANQGGAPWSVTVSGGVAVTGTFWQNTQPVSLASLGSQYPTGMTAVTGTSGNVAAATATASLPAVAAKNNFITGLDFTFSGATAGSVVVATLTGLISGTVSYIISVPVGILIAGIPLSIRFNPAVPASVVNTAITFSCGSLGTGNTNACANIFGYVG